MPGEDQTTLPAGIALQHGPPAGDRNAAWPRPPAPGTVRTLDATATFLVSLYLVLLAFFIMLAVISTFDTAKSERVLQSVTDRMGPGPGWRPDVPEQEHADGRVLRLAGELGRQLREAFAAELPEAHFGMAQSGRIMEAAMPVDLVFPGESTAPHPAAAALLRRVAQAVNGAVPHLRTRVEVVLRAPDVVSPDSTAVRRAAAAARALRNAGLPDSAVLGGVETAGAPELRFVFRVDPDAAR